MKQLKINETTTTHSKESLESMNETIASLFLKEGEKETENVGKELFVNGMVVEI